MNKVHLMTGELTHDGAEKTFCGKVGWESRGIAYEYETADNWRFEGTDMAKKTTCKRCIASFNRQGSEMRPQRVTPSAPDALVARKALGDVGSPGETEK